MIVGCPLNATWGYSGACPGWSYALVNEDYSPAPAVLPAGWTGWICANAAGSVSPGDVCCPQFTFYCDSDTGVVTLCSSACQCGTQNPCAGTPLAGVNGFTMKLRENFGRPGGNGHEPAILYPLPSQVSSGYVVLKDNQLLPDTLVSNWSDILIFNPTNAPNQVAMVSDPDGRPFNDTDVGNFGVTINGIRFGNNTCFIPEKLPFTTYTVGTPATGASATYQIYSDVDTLMPGTPLGTMPVNYEFIEGNDPNEPAISYQLQTPVQPGFLVLYEDSLKDPEDTTNWSDVLYFTPAGPAGQQVIFISDKDIPGGGTGMRDADFTPFGVHIRDVMEGSTMYMFENQPPQVYKVMNPVSGLLGQYFMYSDYGDGATSSVPPSQGRAIFRFRRIVPNPTTGATRIDYEIAQAGAISIEIFNAGGERVRTVLSHVAQAGQGSGQWDGRATDGRALPSGTYFVRLTSVGKTLVQKLVLLR
jgi:hypothetical protein